MTTATTDDLTTKLEETREEIQAAEAELGAASLDNKGVAAAEKRLFAARATEKRLEAAIDEAGRRTEVATQEQDLKKAAAARLVSYEWMVEYLRKAAAVAGARQELIAAIEGFDALPRDRKVAFAKRDLSDKPEGMEATPHTSDLDTDLLESLPGFSDIRETFPRTLPIGNAIPEQACIELANRAEELLSAEKAGRGGSRAMTHEEQAEARRARKLARRRSS